MFVNSLDIKEFRGIRNCKSPIEFSNLTVLIGRNNSGKSTILEALSLLPHPELKDVIFGNQKQNLIGRLHPGTSERLHYQYAGDSRLDYRINKKVFTIDILRDKYVMFTGNTQIYQNSISNHIGTDSKYIKGFVIFFPDAHDLLNQLEARISQLKDVLMKKQAGCAS